MPGFFYRNPANPSQSITVSDLSDPAIPAGWVFCWSDGAFDVQQQTNVAGVNSGGYPAYTGDASQLAAQPKWPNGILGNTSGNKTTA